MVSGADVSEAERPGPPGAVRRRDRRGPGRARGPFV